MSFHSFYRLCIWLPLIVPGCVAGLVHGLGFLGDVVGAQKAFQILLMSLLYGGAPYAVLGLWASWWLRGRTEPEIKRLIVRAPLLMAGIYPPFAVLAGFAADAPLAPFIAVGVLGAIVSLVLGFAYVGIVLLLREELGARIV